MAKINHNNHLDLIGDIAADAKNRGLTFLETDKDGYSGNSLQVKGQNLLNFGTCGYLGIEFHPKLISKSIEFTQKYGTQFSISRTYMTSQINGLLEEQLAKMFGHPAIVQSSTSISHVSAIPTLVSYKDMIVLDQQVHMSVQTGAQVARQKGAELTMIRHNNMEMLERTLKKCGEKYDKVWYLVDGVYSMYGDVAPFNEIKFMMEKYPRLHIYIDDAHGMAWYGKNGTGYAFDVFGINDRIILSTTLAKGFGAVGGVLIFPNDKLYKKVRSFGGPLTFSHPLPPATIGAAIAMTEICLSDEIYTLQNELQEKLDYTNTLLDATDLPVISDPITPIYFIGMGQPKTGYEMVRRVMESGFYSSIGVFPAVPIKNTGLRFTITRHQSKADIKAFVEALTYHYPKVLENENRTDKEIRRAFKLVDKEKPKSVLTQTRRLVGNYLLEYFTDINDIDPIEWDQLLADRGCFDHNGIITQQSIFSGNDKKENNFSFHYIIIRDQKNNEPVLATFLTFGIHKDDMFEHESISFQIEEKRKEDPYYLTSNKLMMGSFLTEGDHLYLDKSRVDWKHILRLFFNEIGNLSDTLNADGVMFRDLKADDEAFNTYLLEEGFLKVNLPDTNIVEVEWKNFDEYLNAVSSKKRRKLKSEVLLYENDLSVEYTSKIEPELKQHIYDLFQNVKKNNLAVNLFDYPISYLDEMSNNPNWEFIYIFDRSAPTLPISVTCCYKSERNYCPTLLGLNYDYHQSHHIYKQSLYQMMCRGLELNAEKIYFGFTAEETKRKFGAIQEKRAAYVQIKDHFNMELIASMASTKMAKQA